ncbi:MAG: acetyl-CoA C-acyltransferase [Gammaproteobacteria bacterium]|nr:acetyl-CoA C-acyltransferase [Gammaproteobacteria bacterium]
MSQGEVVITAIARTPIGNLSGELKNFTAPQLASFAIEALLKRSGLEKNAVQEVILGCVLPAGVGQAPARQAALGAGLPVSVGCTTINKVCGSGMKAIMFANDMLRVGTQDIIIAGGMESMTNAPYLLTRARQGYRLGNSECLDHLLKDGLENAYDGKHMGYFAEICANENHFDRAAQDRFALTSLERAKKAITEKYFAREIVPLTEKTRDGERIIDTDERPLSVNPEKMPRLSPVFMKDGTITAANASSIADGAAAVLLMRAETAKKLGVKPIAKIVGQATHSQSPETFTTAPVSAIQSLLKKINWAIDDVDLFEINEAFAVVAMYAMKELSIPHDKLNIHGGACALGHPVGATGARIIVTLISALQQHKLKRGIAALCIGGGEATAIAVEML